MNIFVGSLPFSLDEADLKESFEAYGQVDSVKIIIDRATGRSKGFGFVEMPDAEQAQKAIAELNGATVGGRSIVVNETEAREQQPQRKSFGGGGRPSFGGGGAGRGGFNRDNNRGGGSYGNRDNNRGGFGGGNSRYNNDRGGYENRGGGGYSRGGGRDFNSEENY